MSPTSGPLECRNFCIVYATVFVQGESRPTPRNRVRRVLRTGCRERRATPGLHAAFPRRVHVRGFDVGGAVFFCQRVDHAVPSVPLFHPARSLRVQREATHAYGLGSYYWARCDRYVGWRRHCYRVRERHAEHSTMTARFCHGCPIRLPAKFLLLPTMFGAQGLTGFRGRFAQIFGVAAASSALKRSCRCDSPGPFGRHTWGPSGF